MLFGDALTRKSLKLLRSANVFWKAHRFLKKSQWWNKSKLEEYQLGQLAELIKHAYENVPFYRKMLDERGLKPKDIQDFKDMKQLPIITKNDIRANLKDVIARNFPVHAIEFSSTGGSTGDPLGFYVEKDVTEAREYAFIKTLWDRVGCNFTDKIVVLRGHPYTVPEGKLWRHSFAGRWLILSSFHLDDNTIPLYIKKLEEFKPKCIYAYPSSAFIFAQYVKSNKMNLRINLKAVLLASEEVYPFQRKLLEDTLGARVFTWYGQSEKVILAGECEQSDYLHIFPEYGITEVVDEKGRDVDYGKAGMTVGTGFINYAMPLIRYFPEDLAILSDKKCSCGREYPLVERVIGRTQNFVIAKNRSLIPLTALIFGQHFKAFLNIKQLQVVQEKVGEIKLRIVKNLRYSSKDEKELYEKVKSVVNEYLDIYFEYCVEIPRTRAGKHKFLIQKLKIPLETTGFTLKRSDGPSCFKH